MCIETCTKEIIVCILLSLLDRALIVKSEGHGFEPLPEFYVVSKFAFDIHLLIKNGLILAMNWRNSVRVACYLIEMKKLLNDCQTQQRKQQKVTDGNTVTVQSYCLNQKSRFVFQQS